ncbi:MAG: c-type cytochrome biogenesis protein CcmI [Candidatus Accumulibacter sp. 66-26]|nr:c-type cytochrome biogenesis protein CcmI [Accumulibacter sp.]OJW48885.1 MAG: c-type cytochrome biogenesis protein CcmI [Candidatus Accumulibacter sp. 66-26]
MTLFVVFAALLVVATAALLLPALLRKPRSVDTGERREANLAIFRDQLAELERERAEGSLGDADFEQARSELQRRLLEEVQPDAPTAPVRPAGRRTAIVLVIALPLLAAAGYLVLGNPRGLDPMQTQATISPQQIEGMLGKLVERLKQNPDDAQGWVMLARSYKVLGRFPEAAEAYSHAGALLDADAALLADYAEVLSQTQGGNLRGKPAELIARALQIAPDEPHALLLAGAEASDRQDFASAAKYWERLLAQLEPGSEEAQTLEAAIAKAREIAGAGGKTAAAGPALSGEVSLSPKLAAQVQPDDVLFVFARAEDGNRMPLAATRATVGQLPLRFRFDDSMALTGGQKLSAFKTVSIEARVAKAGTAKTSSGDLFGTVSGVKPNSQNLRLVIDQVQP